MKKVQLFALSILSGALLFAAWPVSPLTWLIGIAWVPVLVLAENLKKRTAFFSYTYLTVLCWNVGTTWWIWNSTDIGTIAAIIANSFFMCLPWWGYHLFKSRYQKRISYFSLVAFWMCFEYIHLNWQLSWPWLTLGNVFAMHPDWVQWYEYTGVGGGTLLIMISNLLAFELLLAYRNQSGKKSTLTIGICLISIPVFLSAFYLLHTLTKTTHNTPIHNVVIVQPNIDPYEKLTTASVPAQIEKLIRLSEQSIDTATQIVLWPETAMSAGDWQENIIANPYYEPVFAFLHRHPGVSLNSGIETLKNYGTTKSTLTARKTENGNYYDAFNAAVFIKAGVPLQFYNKSKLVPGVESLPTFLNFLAPVFEKFGGTAGGYGRSEESAVFGFAGNEYITAPIICYESIYGEYVSSYVQKGANILTIMTNDGWWGNTPGHQQHLQYARLRAIETRRWVARSANTGISAVIDENGKIVDTRAWATADVIKYPVPALTGLTFYVRYGDYLYKLASLLAGLLILWHLIAAIKKRFFTPAS